MRASTLPIDCFELEDTASSWSESNVVLDVIPRSLSILLKRGLLTSKGTPGRISSSTFKLPDSMTALS